MKSSIRKHIVSLTEQYLKVILIFFFDHFSINIKYLSYFELSWICCCLQNVNSSKLTELLWFTVGGIEEEFGVLIKSLTCNLPFIYTKHTGSQAEDKHVINQLTFFSALTHSGIPKIHFILSFSHSSAFSLSFSFLFFNHHRFAFLIFYFTSLRFALYNGKTVRKKRQTDRQNGERCSHLKVITSDTHILDDLLLSQKHFNFIKGRESRLICIRVHPISSAHMFIALESPFLIPSLIKSQEGNATAGRGENYFADLASRP